MYIAVYEIAALGLAGVLVSEQSYKGRELKMGQHEAYIQKRLFLSKRRLPAERANRVR
jgi:hypothetical protein